MNVLNYPANAYLLDVDIFSRGLVAGGAGDVVSIFTACP